MVKPGIIYEYYASYSGLDPKYLFVLYDHQWNYFIRLSGLPGDPNQYTLDQHKLAAYRANSGLVPADNYSDLDHEIAFYENLNILPEWADELLYEEIDMAVTTSGTIAANGVSVFDTFDALEYMSVSVQVTGTFVGTLAFQVSNDGVNWVSKGLVTGANANATTMTAPGVVSGDVGSRYFRVISTAWTSGTANVLAVWSRTSQSNEIATQAISGSVTANLGTAGTSATSLGKAEDAVAASGDVGVFTLGVRRDAPTISASAAGDYSEFAVGRHGELYTRTIDAAKRTYSAGVVFTPVVGSIFEISGSATTTVEINRITITLTGTAAGYVTAALTKRSAVATGGTAVASTRVPYDAADAAATAVVRTFTAAPTAGAAVGSLRQAFVACGANVPSDRLRFESGQYAKSFTLSGVAQAVTLDLAGTIPAGASVAIDVEWTEF